MSLKPQGTKGPGGSWVAPSTPDSSWNSFPLGAFLLLCSVFHKPQKRNLLQVHQCEGSDRDRKLGPCQPGLVLERRVPRDLCAECRIVSQDPNLKIQDTVQLPASACAQLPTRGFSQACSLLDTVRTAAIGHRESSFSECFQLAHQSLL